jgi:hypothetical protein
MIFQKSLRKIAPKELKAFLPDLTNFVNLALKGFAEWARNLNVHYINFLNYCKLK